MYFSKCDGMTVILGFTLLKRYDRNLIEANDVIGDRLEVVVWGSFVHY
jgi:hypothetical protein